MIPLKIQSKKSEGFTLVELIIVIVVIGILAAIILVAYSGITESAQKTSIASEVKQWEKLFQVYKAQFGEYPKPAADPPHDGGPGSSVPDAYCLGTGFHDVNGTRYCYAYNNTSYRVQESKNATLMTELAKVGSVPKNSKKYTYGNVEGPILRWYNDNSIFIYGVFKDGVDCTDFGLAVGYKENGRQECYVRLS